ncbi:MAG: hypothetical protein KDK40_02460, partial [Chlamydiia bacterium]|nr:hypothetical protein [Chlamydiia bacterium]
MDIEPFDSHLKPTEIRTINETTTRDTFPEVRITVRSPSRAFNTEIEAFQKALKEGNIETRINSLSKKIEESNRKIESDRHSAHEAKKSFFGTRGGLTKVKLFNGTTFLFAIGACGVEVFEKISGEKGNNAVKLAGGLALGATILVSLGVFGGSFLFNRNQRK